MAVRYIATRVAIEGEKEYRESVAAINREYKTLSAELKLVESEFKGQQNTIAALSSRGDTLSKMYDTQAAKVKELQEALENARKAQEHHAQAADEYRQKIAAAEAELERLKNSSGDTSEEQAKLTEEITKMKAALDVAEGSQRAAAAGIENWQQKVNLAQADANNLSHEIDDNSRYLDEAKNSADGCATSIDGYGKATNRAADGAREMGDKTAQAVDAMASLLAAAGVAKTVEEIAEALWAAAEASIEFESAITGVFKTVEATTAQRQAITDGITELSLRIPTTTTELAALAQTAGQLGIETDNILAFTEVMANMGVATDLAGTEAAEVMARLANIMQTSQQDFERMGSTIVALGNNFATTEPKIAEMALRLAGAGTTAGMSEAEVLGLSTALSSLGIEAQMGGSAFSKVISAMQASAELGPKNAEIISQTGMSLRDLQLYSNAAGDDFKALALSMGMTSTELKNVMSQQQQLEDFASVTGMTADAFSRAFGNDAAGTLSQFVMGLARLDDEGQSAIVTLDEMGITELRLRDALLRTTNANELFSKSLDLAGDAWEENIALQKEADTFYGTTESQMKLMENSVNALKVAVGDQFQPALRGALDVGQDLVGSITEFVEQNPEAVAAITALVTVLGVFAIGVTGITVATKLWAVAQTALNAAMASNPVGLVAVALAALTAGIAAFVVMAQDATNEVDELTTAATAMRDSFGQLDEAMTKTVEETESAAALAERYVARLETLEKQGLKTADAQDEYRAVVDMLNALIPELNVSIDEQTGMIEGGTAALRANTEAWKANAIEQAISDKRAAIIAANADALLELETNQRKLSAAEAEAVVLTEARDEAYADLAETLGVTTKQLDEMGGVEHGIYLQGEEQYDQLSSKSEQIQELTDLYASYTGALQENTGEQATLNESIVRGSEAIAEADAELTALSDTAQAFSEKTAAATAATAEQTAGLDTATESMRTLSTDMSALIAQYDEAYTKAHDNIGKTLALFNEVTTQSEMKIQDFIGALDSQMSFMDDYAANIKKAMEMGVDEGLVRSLSNGEEESAQILAAIVAGGEEEIAALNEKLKGVEQGKDDFSTVVADMQTEFSETLDEMDRRMDEAVAEYDKQVEAYNAGAETTRGYADGLKSELAEVERVAREIARAVSDAMADKDKLSAASGGFDGSHAGGLPYVPYDGYIAELHRGERVLTAAEAKAYIQEAMPATLTVPVMVPAASGGAGSAAGAGKTINQTVNIYSPDPLTPSQIARENKNALWGLF